MNITNLPPLIQAMLQPGFYPHPVTEPIELLQTHASYVFLTGEFAYKLKKPVNFGFLDYSTVAQRQHCCQEELRLNQRGAQELYLAVLPISTTGQQFVLNGSGEIVEYALQMVQFPQTALLSNMFEAGAVTADQIVEMAKVVAVYHAGAQTTEYISSFGHIPTLRRSIEENYQQTTKYIGIAQTPQHYAETKAFTDRFFDQHPEVFVDRVQGNFIRECHGDLHLRNVCYWPDRIQLFDCIEFNETFRYVDTMYDVAFATMDLTARGRTDLSNVFLNNYLEQTGDWEGLQVLPLYLSRQAYVRAKVTSFLLDDPTIAAVDRAAAQTTAQDYYQLAWQYTQQPTGRLIVMAGLSGSGKSTVARQIAQQLNAIHLRSDAVRKHLGGIALTDKGGTDLYSPAMTTHTYSRLQFLGIKLARQGYTVILDAKFDRQSWRSPLLQSGLPVQIVHCQASAPVLVTRLQQRTGDIADATADLLTGQAASWENFTVAEAKYVMAINTTQDLTAFFSQL